jgi:hypothetical protein
MPRFAATLVVVCSTLVLSLAGCQRSSDVEQALIAQALQEDVIRLDLINRPQLDAVRRRHQDDVVLVVYWATSSAISMQQLPHLLSLANAYGDYGFRIVTVSMDSPNDRQPVIDMLKATGATNNHRYENFISMYGGAAVAYREFDIKDETVPCFQLFDRAGNLAHSYSISSVDLSHDVETLLASDPELNSTEKETDQPVEDDTRKSLFEPRPLFEDDRPQDGLGDEPPFDRTS